MPGPDFPTGGIIVDPPEAIAEAYATGRGSFRVRARWHKEDTGRGTYQIVITEMPWLVQKARLVEKLAELLNDKKLPLVADVRDESAEDIRLVIEPRARTVDAELLMESLFKLTELESRISLNMNVLVKGRIPKVSASPKRCSEWLDSSPRRAGAALEIRLGKIEHRLEVLGGYLIAYLNLDKVIKIIRTEDEPKPVLIKTFKLTDVQADAILNMRLRNLRKLEEMEIRERGQGAARRAQGAQRAARLREGAVEDGRRRDQEGPREVRPEDAARQAPHRRSREAPEHDEAAIEEAMVEREPITVVVSEKGWIRALRGTVTDFSGIAFKTDDSLKFAFPTETTSKCLVFATNGRFYTLDAAKLPGGRGHGEPIRLFADIEQDADVVTVFRYQGGRKFLVGSAQGSGFVVPEDECLGNTRKGKQVLNVNAARRRARHDGGRGRTRRRDRREPQADDLPARPGAGDDARARRAAAALQGRLAVRPEDLQGGRRPDLDRCRRPGVRPVAQGACRLARQSRRRRPGAARPLPDQQQVRPAAAERQTARRQVINGSDPRAPSLREAGTALSHDRRLIEIFGSARHEHDRRRRIVEHAGGGVAEEQRLARPAVRRP